MEQAVAYAVERGLPGHEICYFLSFYVSCLDAVATNASNEGMTSSLTIIAITNDFCADQTLAKVIQQLQGQIIPTYSNYLSPTSLRYSVEYITTSILQHFHLYQFLLTYTQTTDLTTLEVPVETPVKSPPCLQDAVTEDVWLNWKKKEEMEAEYEKTLKELEETGEEAKLLADMNLKMVCETQLADISNQPVSKERLADIVEALLKAHMDLARVPIEQILLKQDVDMDYRLDQMEALPELSEVLTRLKGQGNSSPNLPSRKNTSRPPK